MAAVETDHDPYFGADVAARQAMVSIHQHIEANDVALALAELSELIRTFPHFAPAYNTLGWLYATPLENPRKAIVCYRRALELDPAYPPVYFNLLVVLNTLGFSAEIPALVERALVVPGIDPGKIYHQLGVMFELARDYAQAERCYEEAILATLSLAELESFEAALQRCQAKAQRSHAPGDPASGREGQA